ncbi:MAG: hypothetical protein WCR46_07390, partial [Deltaproteobacteria bacterium]
GGSRKLDNVTELQPHPAAYLVVNYPLLDSQGKGKIFFVVIPNQPSRDTIALQLNPLVTCLIHESAGTRTYASF